MTDRDPYGHYRRSNLGPSTSGGPAKRNSAASNDKVSMEYNPYFKPTNEVDVQQRKSNQRARVRMGDQELLASLIRHRADSYNY